MMVAAAPSTVDPTVEEDLDTLPLDSSSSVAATAASTDPLLRPPPSPSSTSSFPIAAGANHDAFVDNLVEEDDVAPAPAPRPRSHEAPRGVAGVR
jgi:hypothetical protein